MFDLIDDFLQHKQVNGGRSGRTIEIYRLALHRLVQFGADRDPLKFTHDDLMLFTGVWLHKHGLRDPASRRTHIAAVRQFYAWLASNGRIGSNPASRIDYPKKGRRIPRLITLASAEKLMWAPDFSTFEGVRDGAMLALLVGGGLRVSGLVAMNESHITHDAIDGRDRIIIVVREKGDKERRLPIPPDADLMLRLYLDHPDLKEIDRTLPDGDRVLFISTRNRTVPLHDYIGEKRRLNRRAVLDMIKRYGRAAGIPEDQLHPHAMRHLYGTELIEGDVATPNAQLLMGHADAKSTAIYTHTAMRKLTREVDRANPLAKMRTPVSDLLKQLNKRNT